MLSGLFAGLRTRLLLILLLATAPALGLTLYSGAELRRKSIQYSQENALRYVQSVRTTQDAVIQRTQQLLQTLAAAPEVRMDPAICSRVLRTELHQHTSYTNFGVVGIDGNIICSAFQSKVNIAEWPVFQRTLQSRAYTVGDFKAEGTRGTPAFNFAYPLVETAGSVYGVLFAEADLEILNRALITTTIPSGSTLLVIDRAGVVLASFPHVDPWVGHSLPSSLLQGMLISHRQPTILEGVSPDKMQRLFAFAPLDNRKDASLTFAGVAVPTRIAYDIARLTTRNLTLLTALAASVFLVASIGGHLVFLRPIHVLVEATKRLSEGDLTARTGLGQGKGELAQLARAFDRTAATLQMREEEAIRTRDQLRRYGAQLEQRVAERTAALESAKLEADRANQVKSDFLSKMSHELRTPLNAVLGFSEMLLERMVGDLNPKQEEFVRDIQESGRHLLSLVNDILDISRIEAGRMELHITDTDLNEVVEGAYTTLRPQMEAKHLRFSSTVHPQAALIRADTVRVKQILYNLLSNAVKFTPDGGQVTVEVARLPEEVKITVTDTGPGISPEDQRKLFRPFVQLQSGQQSEYPGTGLGLVLVQRFAELHGGRIELESEVGRGSRFIVLLPVEAQREVVATGSTPDPQHRVSPG